MYPRSHGLRDTDALFLVVGGQWCGRRRRRRWIRIEAFLDVDRVSNLEDLRRLSEWNHLSDSSVRSLSGNKPSVHFIQSSKELV